MAALAITLICLLAVTLLYSYPGIRRVLQTWKFLMKGRVMMLEQAQKSPHFSLLIPGNRLHVMSAKEHWDDFNNAPTSSLSPNAASREMFQPKYTLGFDWSAPREQVSLATVRAIRNMTLKAPTMQGNCVRIMDQEFQRATALHSQKEGWSRVPMWETVQRIVTRINTLFLYGDDLANNNEFIDHGINFITQISLIQEAVKLVPSFLAPIITKLVKGRNLDQRFLFQTLASLVEEREAYNSSTQETLRRKPETFLESFIDYFLEERPTLGKVDAINTVWVTSALAIPVVACHLLQDIYTQPKYFTGLQEESKFIPMDEPSRFNEISPRLERGIPLLEAFAMESMRTKCFQSNTVHRIAVKPFRFSDGYEVPAGEAVEFLQSRRFNDDTLYPEPSKFDPSRFLDKNRSLVDTGIDWSFWGVARHVCPGRWYVANVQKLLAVYLLQNFEAKFESTKDLNFEWRDALVPNPKTILLVRPLSKK